MPIQILMPALSPTMTDGTVAKWHKKEGDTVESGDVLAEIETDKATMEVEAVDEGVLGKILVPEGTAGVPVNQPIAVLLEEGEDAAALDVAVAAGPTETPAAPVAAPQPQPAPPPTAPATPPPAAAQAPAATPAPAPAATAAPSGGRIFASPLARRMAAQGGLDLGAITGSGPHGRIVKRDVEGAMAAGISAPPAPRTAPSVEAPAPMVQPAPAPALGTAQAYTEVPNSTMRKVIARRLWESKRDMPHFYLTIDCALDRLLALRSDLNAKSPEGEGAYKLSVNDFIIRAVALALRQVPTANASWGEEAVRLFDDVDVSVAVATPSGLITPIIRHADQKGLAAISNEMQDLATRAREGKLMPEEYQGGGFTISNLGMYGIREFAAIINPPQACILAVGAGEQRPVVKDGALGIATLMSCTLSTDHRAVDGAVGAEFLAAFRRFIEEPLTMLL